jgi:Lrp/AsnC family transcriptional regulator
VQPTHYGPPAAVGALQSDATAPTIRKDLFISKINMKQASDHDLDRTDLRLLDALQKDGALSAAELAERVGLAVTTCWRRIKRLEDTGVIRSRVALLDRERVGLGVTVFAHVKLVAHGRDNLGRFAEAIRRFPEVLECYTTTGDWDFLLRIVARDIKGYEAFFLDHLSKAPGVQSVSSSIAMTVFKETTQLPLAVR